MVEKNDRDDFLFEFGYTVPAILNIICAGVVYPPGEKLSLFPHFCSNQIFS